MCRNFPANEFKWEKNILKFNDDFIKNYTEDGDKGYTKSRHQIS